MRLRAFALILGAVAVGGAFARDVTDYDSYYRHVLSVGLEYDSLSPPNEFATGYRAYEIAGVVRYPLPFLPILQPLVQAGIYQFTATEPGDAARWDHFHWYGALGVGAHHKFSKSFEMGGELSVGLTEAIYRNIGPEPTDVWGSPHFLTELAGMISFNPSFNLSLSARPSVRLMRSFTDLDGLNGLTFAVGFSASYRFGEDPDAPQAIVRAVNLERAQIPPVFAAMQSYYVNHPIGTGAIKNVEKYPIYDVSISFFQKDFMDSPTKIASLSEIRPGEVKEFDITAAFNDRVFTVVGQTPLNGSLTVDYIMRNRAATQSFTAGYDLHDKTALTWDDLRKVAAFITPADSALRNFASYVRQSSKDAVIQGLSEPLQVAMQIYYALKELGVIYQVDPTSPFSAVQGDARVVDSVSLPRDTLRRNTGDCDDLTALFAALLETVGVETGYITTPGHIYPMINTKVSSRDYAVVHPEQQMTIDIDGELWVPVEITLVAKDEFLGAWRYGIEVYHQYDGNPGQRTVLLTREAQKAFRPVGLRETDAGIVYPRAAQLAARFSSSLGGLVDAVVAGYARRAQESGDRRDFNNLGIAASQLGRYEVAERSFNAALAQDRNYMSPLINLGNLHFLQSHYQDALRSYHRAEQALVERSRTGSSDYATVLLNISRSYHKLENYDRAREYLALLAKVDPQLADQNAYLRSASASGR